MTDRFTDELSAYLDGDLETADHAVLAAHLKQCQQCRDVLEELREVAQWAESFPGREPATDRWPHIEVAIKDRLKRRSASKTIASARQRKSRQRLFTRVPMALAAGISLLIVGAGSWWLARATAPTSPSEIIAPSEPAGVATSEIAILAAERYGAAIAELERVLLDEAPMLNTATVRVLREKMSIIDRAIREAREALAEDPNSDYLADHFTSLMRRKLSMLRNAAAVAVVQG